MFIRNLHMYIRSNNNNVYQQPKTGGIPAWLSGLGTCHCHCCGWGHCCGLGLITGQGSFTGHRQGQKKERNEDLKILMNGTPVFEGTLPTYSKKELLVGGTVRGPYLDLGTWKQ